MKLTIEKHPDFSRLTHYFRSIEDLAANLGIDVDSLHSNHHFHQGNVEFSVARRAIKNPGHRAEIYRASFAKDSCLKTVFTNSDNSI